jgi:hypothetical protein
MSRFLSSLWDGLAALQGGADQCVGAALRDPYPARTQAALALLGQIATLVGQLDDLYTRAEDEPESHPDQPTEPTLDATPTLPALSPATPPALSQLRPPASEEAPPALSVLRGGEPAPEEPLPLVPARKTAEERRAHLASVALRRWGVGQKTITRYLLAASEVLEHGDLSEAAHWIADARTRLAYELHNAETAGEESLASWRETEHRLRLATDHLATRQGTPTRGATQP